MTKVNLVSYTKPTEEFEQHGLQDAQDLIAFCARVSNPSSQINSETSEKLIKYLIKHQHWSPLEMVNAVLEINTTRDIAHQIVRHRSFSFQEFSQRYADVSSLGDMFVHREARMQDTKNRQNSVEVDDKTIQDEWQQEQRKVIEVCKQVYKNAIEKGIAKEVARAVLPEGLTESRLYMNGTIRSWIHFIELRSANGTQKECIEVAKACAKAITNIFPMVKEFVNE